MASLARNRLLCRQLDGVPLTSLRIVMRTMIDDSFVRAQHPVPRAVLAAQSRSRRRDND
jgi:hypothetical protein